MPSRFLNALAILFYLLHDRTVSSVYENLDELAFKVITQTQASGMV